MFLTVKQFADAAHISTQRLYTLMNAKSTKGIATELQRHCKQENGSKYIDSAALALFSVANPLQTALQTDETGENTRISNDEPAAAVANPLQTAKSDTEKAAIEALQSIISAQQRQIDEQAAELDTLHSKLHEAEKAAAELSAALDAMKPAIVEKITAIDKLQSELDTVRGALHTADTEKAAAVAALDAERKRADAAELKADSLTERLATIAERQADALRASEARQLIATQPAEDEPQPRKGLLKRLFHRKND